MMKIKVDRNGCHYLEEKRDEMMEWEWIGFILGEVTGKKPHFFARSDEFTDAAVTLNTERCVVHLMQWPNKKSVVLRLSVAGMLVSDWDTITNCIKRLGKEVFGKVVVE